MRIALLSVAVLCACSAGSGSGTSSTADAPATAVHPAGFFAIGRAPTDSEVTAWDIAIGENGEGLPEGQGSAMEGQALFAANCASCHGAKGEGMPGVYPMLIGRDPRGEDFDFASDPKIERTIGNYWPYATTLFDYIRRAMPLTAPGSMNNDQVYALTAWLLAANKVIPDTAVLDAAALRAVKMPARDRFVPDDRTSGSGIR